MISIIVPCYNSAKTLERCVDSLINQTQKNIEIILVDDGSTDTTYEICQEYAQKDSRVNVIHQVNQGLVKARITGIKNAHGHYIAFCDSDDYIDNNLIEKTEKTYLEYKADIILFGSVSEYDNGTICKHSNKLQKGFFTKEDIRDYILPHFFSNGKMGSNIMSYSMWSKVFKKELLLKIIFCLDEKVTNGEDEMISFAAVLNADSIYCMGGFHPYHYMRNNNSMIGKYDEKAFDKLLTCRNSLLCIADLFDYCYPEQIEADFISTSFLRIKKEICRNPHGYKVVKKNLTKIRENDVFCSAIATCNIEDYDIKSKVFAKLIIQRRYLCVYVLTKTLDKLGFGTP